MEKLGKVKAVPFNDFLLIPLDKKWGEVLGEPVEFKAILDNNGKLKMISTKSFFRDSKD